MEERLRLEEDLRPYLRPVDDGDEGSGPSPQVRTRVPQALKDRLAAVARQQQRSESEVVREALTVYLAQAAG